MKKKALVVPIILFALFVSITYAVKDYEADIYPVKQSVYPKDVAEFKVEITNNLAYEEKFTIYTQSMRPGWFYQKDYALEIGPGETKSTIIYVTPDKEAVAGNRGFYVYIYPKKNFENYKKLSSFVNIIRTEKIIVTNLKTPKINYKPGESVKVLGTVKNVAALKISGYSLEASLGGLSKSISIPMLNSAQEYDFELELPINESLVGVQEIVVKILDAENKVEGVEKTKINVPQIQSISIKRSDKNFFLWHTYTISVKNNGNVKKELQEVSAVVTRMESYLLHSENKISDKRPVTSGIRYSWVVHDLNPGEIATINYRINYWILFLILIFVVGVGVFAYYEFRNPSIVKIARRAKREHSIHLFVKNNTKNTLNKVRVIDHVPEIVKLIEKFESVKPTSIKKRGNFLELEWTLGNLAPQEERILSYKIIPVVRVEGPIKLPKAQLEYLEKGNKRKKRSNIAVTYF